ncbi:MAG TPA: helix-turn-helix domain-containing protein [Leucothrix sp.]|nr:helix-turn-helix domain-containing protein [Leucothrix sp.]HIQ14097.1 helix-turn-helix domain-containing protein [Leucothrix sp.]
MIIRKLRLQRGWSQEQLSQMSGISTRTIQRIERGQKASAESLKSLAAVFETNFTELQQEIDMNTQTSTNDEAQITDEEGRAIEYVRDIKGFYSHAIKYVVVIAILFVINFVTSPNYIWAWWVVLGWGIGILSHALSVFEVFSFFGPDWEKKKIEKRLGRKL